MRQGCSPLRVLQHEIASGSTCIENTQGTQQDGPWPRTKVCAGKGASVEFLALLHSAGMGCEAVGADAPRWPCTVPSSAIFPSETKLIEKKRHFPELKNPA